MTSNLTIIKLVYYRPKNKKFAEKMTNNSPVNYWTLKSDEKIPRPKQKKKFPTSGNINNSNRTIKSNSKSRSSVKCTNKEFK